MVQEHLSYLPLYIQQEMIKGVLDSSPEKVKEDFWRKQILSLLAQARQNDEFLVKNLAWIIKLSKLLSQIETIHWFELLDEMAQALGKHNAFSNIVCYPFYQLVDFSTNQEPEKLRAFLYRTEVKKYPCELKKQLYRMGVKAGIFDIKLARRVRSDTSGALSTEILSYLFENRYRYSDDLFQTLVTQFCDTKHRWVAMFIALNMPIHLTPFLIGLNDPEAKRVLEGRLNASNVEGC